MACLTLDTGRDTDVRIYRMNGNCDRLTLPTGADNFYAVTNGAAAAAQGATDMTLAATLSDMYANNFLKFVDATSGTDTTVKLLNDLALGATATGANSVRGLNPNATGIDAAVPAGAIAEFPPRLGGRTSASVTQAGNTVGNLVFEDGLFMAKNLTSIDTSVSLQGNFLESDPGMWTAYDAFTNAEDVAATNLFLIITLRAQKSATYTKGSQWAMEVIVNNAEMGIETEGIKSFNLSAEATGVARLVGPSL